jgi:two-component system OmpR family sensor kinase
LLDISRLTTGKFQLNVAEVDLSTVVSEIGADFAAFADAAGVVLTIAVAPGAIGLFDRAAVEEIVENLISNAVKYGWSTGSGQINATGKRNLPAGGGSWSGHFA